MLGRTPLLICGNISLWCRIRGNGGAWVIRVGSILTIAAAAVAAESRSFTAIGEWAADASQKVLARLGARRDQHGVYQAPNEATVRRVLQAVDPDALDTAVSA
jgi:hypothetical protein